MSAIGLILAGVLVSAQPSPDTSSDKKYALDFSKTTKAVKPGKSGVFYMRIKAADGFKVSTEAPLKIGLSSGALELHKKVLKVKDAKDKKAKSPEFGVKFAAPKECDTSIEVDASFFVCDANICERKKEKVTIPVSVRN